MFIYIAMVYLVRRNWRLILMSLPFSPSLVYVHALQTILSCWSFSKLHDGFVVIGSYVGPHGWWSPWWTWGILFEESLSNVVSQLDITTYRCVCYFKYIDVYICWFYLNVLCSKFKLKCSALLSSLWFNILHFIFIIFCLLPYCIVKWS